MTLICSLIFFMSTLSFSITKKLTNNFEVKFDFKGKDVINMLIIAIIGVLGVVSTGGAGRCKTRC